VRFLLLASHGETAILNCRRRLSHPERCAKNPTRRKYLHRNQQPSSSEDTTSTEHMREKRSPSRQEYLAEAALGKIAVGYGEGVL